MLHLPHLVDDELRRLPPADRSQLEDRAASLRRRRNPQLRDLQPAGRARPDVHDRQAEPGERRQDRAGALVFRARAVIDQCQPRTHLRAAAADRGQRLQFTGDESALSAHGAQDRNEDLHRLSPVRGGRQQRHDGAAAVAGHELRQLRRLHSYVGRENGVAAAQVTEWDEPQAVIGSYLHRYAYPDNYRRHLDNDQELQTGYEYHDKNGLPAAAWRIPFCRRRQGRRGSTTSRTSRTRDSASASSPRRFAARSRYRRQYRKCAAASHCRPISPYIRRATKAS